MYIGDSATQISMSWLFILIRLNAFIPHDITLKISLLSLNDLGTDRGNKNLKTDEYDVNKACFKIRIG